MVPDSEELISAERALRKHLPRWHSVGEKQLTPDLELGVAVAERVTEALRYVFSKSRMESFLENPNVSAEIRENAQHLLNNLKGENPFKTAEDLAKKEELRISHFLETDSEMAVHFANCGELASACVHEFPEDCHLYRCKLIGDLPNKGEIQHIVLMYTLGKEESPDKLIVFDPWMEVLLPTEDYWKYVVEKTGVKIKSLTAIERTQNVGATYCFDENNNIVDGNIPVVDKRVKDTITAYDWNIENMKGYNDYTGVSFYTEQEITKAYAGRSSIRVGWQKYNITEDEDFISLDMPGVKLSGAKLHVAIEKDNRDSWLRALLEEFGKEKLGSFIIHTENTTDKGAPLTIALAEGVDAKKLSTVLGKIESRFVGYRHYSCCPETLQSYPRVPNSRYFFFSYDKEASPLAADMNDVCVPDYASKSSKKETVQMVDAHVEGMRYKIGVSPEGYRQVADMETYMHHLTGEGTYGVEYAVLRDNPEKVHTLVQLPEALRNGDVNYPKGSFLDMTDTVFCTPEQYRTAYQSTRQDGTVLSEAEIIEMRKEKEILRKRAKTENDQNTSLFPFLRKIMQRQGKI